jgi:hypothetical protein
MFMVQLIDIIYKLAGQVKPIYLRVVAVNIKCNIASMVGASALLLAVACQGALAELGSGSLPLVKEGRPLATIVVPKEADEWTSKAAQWLAEYVRKASGAELSIVGEDQAPSGTLISVGHTKLAERAGIDVSELKWDGCKLVVKKNVLYLIGRDQAKVIKSSPLIGAKGTCRAALTFLEDFCGVRWFLPGSEGEIVPKHSDIDVPIDLQKTVIPDFAYSDGRFPYDPGFLADGGGTPAAIANNYRVGIAANTGGTTYIWMFPVDKYKDHPEYFALVNGKRMVESRSGGYHLCSSNPDVRRIMVEEIGKKFDEGYDMVSIGQEDGYIRCQCPECEKLDDYRWPDVSAKWGGDWEKFFVDPEGLRKTPVERLFLTHKWVADELRKSHPNKKVALMAYAPTGWPSRKIDRWPDNVVVEIHHPEPEVIAAWQGKAAEFTTLVHWFNIQLPMGMDLHHTPKESAEWLRRLHEAGFIGVYQFQETNWGLQGPSFYVAGRVMGNVNADEKALTEEYCRGVYGKAAETMLKFFDVLYTRHEGLLTYDQKLGPIRHPRSMSTADLVLLYYPPSHLNQLEQLLEQAESQADTDRARRWVRLTRDHFDYSRLLTLMLISYRAWEATPTQENWLTLKARVDDFENYRMRIITYSKEYTDVWFPGYDHFCNFLTANAQHESNIYYVPWEKRKDEVLNKGVRGTAIGYGGTFGYNYVKEPLTIDFSKPPTMKSPEESHPAGAPRFK